MGYHNFPLRLKDHPSLCNQFKMKRMFCASGSNGLSSVYLSVFLLFSSSSCKYSHDIFSETNRKILKNHELSGLNEEELCVLLLQNDPFLLPDVCGAYNKGGGTCTLNDSCSRLHICRYFLKGECRFPRCKRSHNLLDPLATSLLISEGLDQDTIWNIQAICDARIAAFIRDLREPFYTLPSFLGPLPISEHLFFSFPC
ncbi:zinc finger CCCH-type antiviral protein 1-like [Pseudonaja textilis]|uniref:zinc finger CCCH-type antiviral protein 1-like n=1 Tax=Pseudonaja textilis TaxID=8673 RepID=UPI000EA96BED|nr:zinc finger CCCH-type antiviral protein 1-like [Pseudonaja textilis]